MSDRCMAMDDLGFFFAAGGVDAFDPSYVQGKGIWIPRLRQCMNIADVGDTLCYKHRFHMQNGADPGVILVTDVQREAPDEDEVEAMKEINDALD